MTATTETLEQAGEPGRHSPWLRFGLAFAVGLVAVLLIGVGALYAYDQQYVGRVLPGVRVGSVDLSGLTPEVARAQLQDAYGSLSEGRIVLTGIEDAQVITYAEIGRGPDLDALLDAALAVGRHGSPIDRAVADARTALRGVVLDPRVTFDGRELAQRVTALADSLRIDPQDSTVALDDQQFVVVPGHVGRAADPAPVILALTGALAQMDAPSEIKLDLGVSVLEPDVSAAEAFDARRTAERVTEGIDLVVGDEKLAIDGAELRGWVSFRKTPAGGYEPVIGTMPLTGLIEDLAKQIDREPVNAEFVTVSGLVTDIVPSKDGYKLDVAATVAQIQQLLADRAGGSGISELVPVLAVTPPALTTAEARAAAPLREKISEWKTYFPISEKNGFGANIWIPALEIDGYVVGPHETFDFWDAIGPVTRERGYRDGGAIINGRTEPQGALAGGICSCSTTLFNAALRAGYEMLDRKNHFYFIDRYPTGLDATVFKSGSGSVQTMSWRNDTKYPVLIRGFKIRANGKGYVRFILYSVPNGRHVVIGNPTIRNVRPASDTIVYTSSLPAGSSERVEFPVNGMDVWRTVTVYENGKVLRRTTYYSHYSRIT
ncbi:MAG TPA: VanW family protein, partial [Candidatus Limnocylindrales bacterium]|nr:VanW family protein [Candidatus Limnocylindrales bacterium]